MKALSPKQIAWLLPGAISGVVLFIHLGNIIVIMIMPRLRENERIIAIVTGIIVLFIAGMIVLTFDENRMDKEHIQNN